MPWSENCDCGISWSYSLIFFLHKLEFRESDVSPGKTEVKHGKIVEFILGKGLF